MTITRRRIVAFSAALGLAGAIPRTFAQPAATQPGSTPLLMPGKKTLFQRVLVRPGAVIADAPGGAARGAPPRPFDLLYVFERRVAAGSEWLRVSPGRSGPLIGWIAADRCIPWRQTIVVAFSNHAGRERALLFSSSEAIEKAMDDPQALDALRRRVLSAALRPDDPVISIEPDSFVDIRQQFYLLPILDQRTITRSGRDLLTLRVASVAKPGVSTPPRPKVFRTGIVFVIDTTLSMQPFIERTREAVRTIYNRVQGSEVSKNLSFGLVAFRNSIERTRGLEYVAKVILPLSADQDPADVLNRLADVEEAKVSSHDFREDVYAGVNLAIEQSDWEAFAGRYVIIITDSGPLPANDPTSSTRLDATALRDHARARGISLSALHLITQVNRRVYGEAVPALKTLCAGIGSDQTPRYYPIANGSPAGYASSVQELTEAIVAGLRTALQQRRITVEPAATGVARLTQIDTLAMQLAFLGRSNSERAPDILEGWLADRALEKPELTALDVQILMTKNELSTMRESLVRIVDEGNRGSLASTSFFERIRGALAVMARDPSRLVRTDFQTLGQAMAEFLEDLPYRSEIQDITDAEWVSRSRPEQREILDRLQAKIRAFDRFHDDPSLWTALHPGAAPDDMVFPLPLSSLP